MNRKKFARDLVQGTELIVEAASQRMDFREFITEYDNFYHYNALDGHDANAETASLLRDFSKACRLHEAVQSEVVDLLYLGDDNPQQYVAAGRLLPASADDRLREIAKTHDAAALLQELRAAAC